MEFDCITSNGKVHIGDLRCGSKLGTFDVYNSNCIDFLIYLSVFRAYTNCALHLFLLAPRRGRVLYYVSKIRDGVFDCCDAWDN